MPERSLRILFVVVFTSLAFGCWQRSTTGPGEVHFDRQTCERCQMVISERRHAVQTRTPGDPTAQAFDDLGCAVLWLDEQKLSESDPRQEIWVRDSSDAQWISAYGAKFEDGLPTPMAYGFAAAREGLTFEVVRERIRSAERARRAPSQGHAHHHHEGNGRGGSRDE